MGTQSTRRPSAVRRVVGFICSLVGVNTVTCTSDELPCGVSIVNQVWAPSRA